MAGPASRASSRSPRSRRSRARNPSGTLAGFNLVSAAESRNPDGGLALIDFLTRAGPVRRAALRYHAAPALAATYRDPFFTDEVAYHDALEQAVRQSRARPVTPAYPAISAAIRSHVGAALAGRESVPVALRRADAEIGQALRRG